MSRIVTDELFEQEVVYADHPILVDVWAAWCMPCKAVVRELDLLEHKYLDLDVVKIDADNSPMLLKDYGIMSLPTLMYFAPGESPKSIVGAAAASVIEEKFGLSNG